MTGPASVVCLELVDFDFAFLSGIVMLVEGNQVFRQNCSMPMKPLLAAH
jgi:hypothetical protein